MNSLTDSRMKSGRKATAEGSDSDRGCAEGSRGWRKRAWLLYLALGVPGTAIYFLLPSITTQNVAFGLIGASAVAATVVGTLTHRPRPSLPWWCFALGVLLFVSGDLIWTFYENVLGVASPFPSGADVLYLAAYPCFGVGLVLMIRNRVPGRQWQSVIDSFIAVTGVGMLSWTLLMEPYAIASKLSLLERLILIAYPLMDLVLFTILLHVLFSGGRRPPTYYLLSTSLVLLLIADTVYAARIPTGAYQSGDLLDAWWLLSYVALGASALHPSMETVMEAVPYAETKLTLRRLMLLAAASLIVPGVLATEAALGKQIDVPLIVGGSAALFALVTARMAVMIRERARAEEALRDAEARYRTLVEQIPTVTFIDRAEGSDESLYVSPQIEAMVGYSPEEWMVGRLWRERLHPDDRERILASDKRFEAEGQPVDQEYRLLAKDGSVVWVREETILVRDEADEPLFVQGILSNITQHKRVEAALREAEDRYRTLVERLPAVAYINPLSETSPSTYISPQVEVLLGYSLEESKRDPKLWDRILHPDDRGRVIAEEARTSATGEPFKMEYRMIARDGRAVWIRDEAVLVSDEEDRPRFWQGVMLDITERKLAEQALEEAEARYRTLVEQIPAIVYIEEMNGRMTTRYDSPQIETMLGYPKDKYLEDPDYWGKILHPDDRERVEANERRATAWGESLSQEYRVVAADGRTVWVRDDGVIVQDEAGDPLYWQGFIFDITERKEAEERLRASEAELRALFEAMTDVILVLDKEGRYLKIAPTNPSLLYRPSSELLGRTVHEVFPKEQADALFGHIRQALTTGRPVTYEYDLQIGDRQVWFESTFSPMLDDSVIVVARDVTERRKSEEAMRRSEAGLAEAQRMAHLGSWEWDVRTGEVWWSDEVFRIYGFQPGEFTPDFDRLNEVVHPEDRELLRQNIDGALHNNELYDFEHRVLRPSGEVRVVHRRAEVVRGEGGEPLKMVGTVHDITERKILEEKLEHQAFHDTLTGMPNRALFIDRLHQALRRTMRRAGEVAVLFIDLDNFKVINDSLGHEAGDELLVEVSKRLLRCLRPEDTAARIGGDEFVVLLEDLVDQGEAIRVAKRIISGLRLPFALDRRQTYVSATIGIALNDSGRNQPAELLRDADAAMYKAKEEGGLRVFDPSMHALATSRLELENSLRQALQREEFGICYQPQVNLQTGKAVGFEALVRWYHPVRGLVSPSEFIPVAEETGLIVPLGWWVLKEACHQAKEWHERYPSDPPLLMNVNLSAKQLKRPDAVETVERLLKETGLDPHCLSMDITETALIGAAKDESIIALKRLRELGVWISIDDFGTGYSSLAYLKRLPADILKVDKSFVDGLGEDVEDMVLVQLIIDTAHTLGMHVVAEGLESAEQAKQLKEMGCDIAQGYYFCEPLPPEAASAFLIDRGAVSYRVAI